VFIVSQGDDVRPRKSVEAGRVQSASFDQTAWHRTAAVWPAEFGLGVRNDRRKSVPFIYRLIAFAMLSANLSPASAAPPFGVEAICRTAIASMTDRNPKLMQVTRTVGDVLFLTYVRPIDNFVWTYRCRIEGNRVVWATEPGRWRQGPKDDKVFYEIVDAGKQLRIVEDHGDGTSTKRLFDRDAIL
jgi:hypothetical protein